MPTQERAELETGPGTIIEVDSWDVGPEEPQGHNDEDLMLYEDDPTLYEEDPILHADDDEDQILHEDPIPPVPQNVEDPIQQPVQEQGTVRRSTRHRAPPDRYGFH